MTATSRIPTKRVMTMTRVFEAPRDLVWRVYTEPEHVVHWLSAATWTTPSADIDLRRGGTINVEMRPLDPKDGEGFVFGGTYDEVREPELIVLVIGDGRIMRTEFEEAGKGKTKLTLSWEMAMDEELERGGYSQILDKLTEYLRDRRKGEREIVITRVFDAPREAVFEAWTTAEGFRQWFGPKRVTLSVAEFDPRAGGAFAFSTRFDDGDGTDYWSRGTFREVVAPRRIVMTLAGNAPDGSIVDTVITVTFLDRGPRTLMLLHQTDKNPALRRAFIGGWSDGLDKLAAYLARR